MTIASILCSGPSLTKFPRDRRFPGLTIAVNEAIMHTPGCIAADWWCCMDPDAFTMWPGNPRIGCIGAIPDGHAGECIQMRSDMEGLRREGWPIGGQRSWWTWQAAVVFAVRRECSWITMYGMDLSGNESFTGETGSNRGPSRWEVELSDFIAMAEFLAPKGITLKRWIPE